MLLAIDVGNTQTVVGLFDGAPDQPRPTAGTLPGLRESWRVTTVAERTPEEHFVQLAQLLALGGVRLGADGRPGAGDEAIDGVVVSSSVPRVGGALTEMAGRFFAAPLVVVGPGIRTGMPIRYENPRDVGADRVTNAVAALDLVEPPIVVVDLGTATTFDVISASGEYLGGVIAPGLDISMDALYDHAAALPRVALGEPRRVIGRTTVESMQAGAIYGHAALVDGLCTRLREELGDATVIATGGLAGLVAPHARCVDRLEPWLTLHGLRLLFKMNAHREHERRGGDW